MTFTAEEIKQKIVQHSDPFGKIVLYRPTQRVDDIAQADIQNLIAHMRHTVRGMGVGLAANQVGQGLQIFMLEFVTQKEDPSYTPRYVLNLPAVPFQIFINPKITAASHERIAFWHGCLSAASHPRGLVATYRWIEYEAYNEHGELKKGRLDGMGAVIFQHEFRHLLGSLYLDHAQCFMPFQELQERFASGKDEPYKVADASVPLLLSDYRVGESIDAYAARLFGNETKGK